MPKINVRGINKNALFMNIFVELNAKDPNIQIPTEDGAKTIAKKAWGFDDAADVLDDTQLASMENVPGLVQRIVDQLRVEQAAEARRQALTAAVASEKKQALDKAPKTAPAAPIAPVYPTLPVPSAPLMVEMAPPAYSQSPAFPILDQKTADEIARLAMERKYAEEAAKWEAQRRAVEAQRQAADLEAARVAREAIRIEEETARKRAEAQRLAAEAARLAAEADAEAAKAKARQSADRKVSLELPQLGGLVAESEAFDQYHNELLRSWIAENKLAKEVEGIYLTKQSKLVNILAKTPEAANAIYAQFVKDLQGVLKRQGVNSEELCNAVYPPSVLEALWGFRIPFEKNAISGDSDTAPVLKDGRLEGALEVKMPYIRIADAKKLVWYIIQRLEKGITEASLNENHPSIEALLPTLPEVPTDEATQQLIKSYEGLVRFQESFQAPGYGRVLFDNFEVMTKELGAKIKSTDLSKLIVDTLVRQTRNGVSINEAELCELMAKLYGEKPRLKTGKPEAIMPGVYSVPVELYAPKLPHDKSNTAILVDISGSMGSGRLTALKKAMKEAVTMLAQKPNQTLTILAFESSTHDIYKGPLNEDTLAAVLSKIDALHSMGGTNAQPTIEQALNALEMGVNQKIILGTDGEFDSFSKDRLVAIIKGKSALPSISVFAIDYDENSRGVQNLEDLISLGAEGSQLIFTKKEEMDKTVKNLILDKANRAIDALTVTLSVDGARPQSLVLTPCMANKIVSRFVDIPKATAEHAISQNKPITLTFNCVYDDKTVVSSHVVVTPLDLIAAQKQAASARAKRDYINEWYNHALYKRGIKQANQLNMYSLEEQLKLLSDVQAAARAEKLPHDFVPDALMFVLGKWYKTKQAELQGYTYSSNPEAKFKKLSENVTEAEKYGFYSLGYAFRNEMQAIEEKLWVDRRIADLAKVAFELTITSEAALDDNTDIDTGMRVDIYRRILLEAQALRKAPEIIARIKGKIAENWLEAEVIERSDAKYKDKFENLSIEQQLDIINDLRAVCEKDPMATDANRKALAQMWINRTLAVNVADITRDASLLAKPAPQATPAPVAPVVEEPVRHHRFRRRGQAAPVATAAPATPKAQEALTRVAQAMLRLSFEQHQELLARLQATVAKTNDKLAADIITGSTEDMKRSQEEARSKGTIWTPPAEDVIPPITVPKRAEQTFNSDDATGQQNAVYRTKYRKRTTNPAELKAQREEAQQRAAARAARRAAREAAEGGERNLLGLVVMVAPVTPAPVLLSGGPQASGLGLAANEPAKTAEQLEQERIAREQAKAFAAFSM